MSTREPLSTEAESALDAGLKSGREEEPVSLGSFAQYTDDSETITLEPVTPAERSDDGSSQATETKTRRHQGMLRAVHAADD